MVIRNLRARFILAAVGIAAIPIIVLGVIAGTRSASELERQSLILQSELAARVGQEVTSFVSTRLSELRLLERTNQLVGATKDAKADTLARLLAHDRVYQVVAIVAPDGKVDSYASRTGVAPGEEDRWESSAFAQQGFWEGRSQYVGPIEYDTSVREPLFDIAIPIRNRRFGSIDSIIAVRVRFKPIWELLADLPLPEETEAYVVAADGRVLAHRSPATVLAGTVIRLPKKPGRHTSPDGRTRLLVWEQLSIVGGPASVLVTRPVDVALASANALLTTTIGMAAVLVLIASLAALQQARLIARPVEALAQAARQISSGDLTTQIKPFGPSEIMALGVALRDMTGQLKQTISRLERAEYAERQRALVTLESIGDAVITTDTEGRVVYINPEAERLTGWNQEEAEGYPLSQVFNIVNGTTREPAPSPVERCLISNTVVELGNDTVLLRRDGSEMSIADSAAPIREVDGSVQGVVMVFRDVTDRLELEAAVAQSQKLEAIGQLTGGVAHDFNNLLQVIQGHAELLMLDKKDNHESAESIVRAAKRGGELTSRLLSFGRRQTLLPEPIEIGTLFERMLSMLSRTIGETYSISAEVEPGTWPGFADPGQLEAALLNLVLNARDAMPEGGPIVIGARNDWPAGPVAVSEGDGAGSGFVAITVADTGVGMTHKTIDQAVEPFFTTKSVGDGSGLGLSMVYGFVRQSNGFLDIDSTPKTGTTVTMYLPRARSQEMVIAPAEPKESPQNSMSGEKILIVEDDADVREQAQRTLQSLGYQVVSAEDVDAAYGALEGTPDIALVLTDVVLPGGKSGIDLMSGLAKSNPDLPVCLMSGYPQSALHSYSLPKGAPLLLNKPFGREELAEMIASCLTDRSH